MSTSRSVGRGPSGVARVFYQEIKEGDRRKIEGKSNDDPKAGGGARDLRFPDKKFRRLFVQMFPNETRRTRRFTDQGVEKSEEIVVHSGDVHWVDDKGANRTTTVLYWPPTHARPPEGRIANINVLGALKKLPPQTEGRLFVLITEYSDGTVHVRHASMAGIERGNAQIADHIKRCVASTPDHRSVRGYIDFATGQSYCHG